MLLRLFCVSSAFTIAGSSLASRRVSRQSGGVILSRIRTMVDEFWPCRAQGALEKRFRVAPCPPPTRGKVGPSTASRTRHSRASSQMNLAHMDPHQKDSRPRTPMPRENYALLCEMAFQTWYIPCEIHLRTITQPCKRRGTRAILTPRYCFFAGCPI